MRHHVRNPARARRDAASGQHQRPPASPQQRRRQHRPGGSCWEDQAPEANLPALARFAALGSSLEPAGTLSARSEEETGGGEVARGSSRPEITRTESPAVADGAAPTALHATARPRGGQAPPTLSDSARVATSRTRVWAYRRENPPRDKQVLDQSPAEKAARQGDGAESGWGRAVKEKRQHRPPRSENRAQTDGHLQQLQEPRSIPDPPRRAIFPTGWFPLSGSPSTGTAHHRLTTLQQQSRMLLLPARQGTRAAQKHLQRHTVQAGRASPAPHTGKRSFQSPSSTRRTPSFSRRHPASNTSHQ